MSRYTGRSHQYGVVYGWEPSLQTFYAQIFDLNVDHREKGKEERAIVKWWGIKYREISEPEIIAELVEPWVHIPDEKIEELREDERKEK